MPRRSDLRGTCESTSRTGDRMQEPGTTGIGGCPGDGMRRVPAGRWVRVPVVSDRSCAQRPPVARGVALSGAHPRGCDRFCTHHHTAAQSPASDGRDSRMRRSWWPRPADRTAHPRLAAQGWGRCVGVWSERRISDERSPTPRTSSPKVVRRTSRWGQNAGSVRVCARGQCDALLMSAARLVTVSLIAPFGHRG
jgi:hypothetical protein